MNNPSPLNKILAEEIAEETIFWYSAHYTNLQYAMHMSSTKNVEEPLKHYVMEIAKIKLTTLPPS